ncbi:hypothetical protein JOQ06_003322 [Pogonophryne albipinna]|uniref:Uncharacterized protein n=1 Tax=Pogonophryne albipinna TaxID=1090488 RepID=A0AAD6FKV7_9TELE|nr:hypothetical protein JOQ06_003322 [Pogonophryne albipinna]
MSYTILSNNIIFHHFSGLQWEEEEDEVATLKRTIVSLNDALQASQGYNRTLRAPYLALQRKHAKLQNEVQIFGTAEPLAPLQTLEADPSGSTGFPDHVAALNVLLEDFRKLQEGPDPSPSS